MKHWPRVSLLVVVVSFGLVLFWLQFTVTGLGDTPSSVPAVLDIPSPSVTSPSFTPGSIVQIRGYIQTNDRRIDAPSYFVLLGHQSPTKQMFKVFYAGDLCQYPKNNAFDFTAGMEVMVQGQVVRAGELSLCETSDSFVTPTPIQ